MPAHCVDVCLAFKDFGHSKSCFVHGFSRKAVPNWLCQVGRWVRKSFLQHSEWAQWGATLQSHQRKRERKWGIGIGSHSELWVSLAHSGKGLIQMFMNFFKCFHSPAVYISSILEGYVATVVSFRGKLICFVAQINASFVTVVWNFVNMEKKNNHKWYRIL